MFEVRPCEFGSGVFAVEDIPPMKYVGTYIGKLISREQYKQKRDLLSRYIDYGAEVPNNPNFLYDPTDDKGDILHEFKNNIPLYINEPPPGYLNNCCWVFNKHDDFNETTTLEMWTFRPVKQDEQLFIFYGNDYAREYAINKDDNACGLPDQFNFTIKSHEDSSKITICDYPKWFCELIDSASQPTNSLLDIWKSGQTAVMLRNNPLQLVDKCKDPTLIPFLHAVNQLKDPT